MKKYSKAKFAAAILGLLLSVDAFAGYYACRKADLIDLRGDPGIDGVLGDGPDGYVTIAEVAAADPLNNLGTLVQAVLAADPAVLESLSDPSARLTVFAPDNTAFGAVPEPLLNAILSDQAVLTDVLLYHVVQGRLDPRRVFYIRSVNSLLGQKLFIERGRSNPSINQSQIGCTGVRTDNGVVWLIDSVLLPQFRN